MATNNHYCTPQPAGGPTYQEPLLDWIGTQVVADWAGREVPAVVEDVDVALGFATRAQAELKLETEAGATLTVTPDEVTVR